MVWAKAQNIPKTGAKLVLMCLADHASEKNDYRCWAGRKQIAEDASMTTRTVSAHLNWLEENGYIRREQRHRDDGTRTTDIVHLNVEGPSANFSRGSESFAGPSENSSRHEPVNNLELSNDSSQGSEVQAAYDAWNRLADDLSLPRARKLTPERRKRLKTRLAEESLSDWMEALAKIRGSPFCQGENSNGWRIDFDALCKPRIFNRLMEGSYDDRTCNTGKTAPDRGRGSPQSRVLDAFLQVAAEGTD